MKKAAKILRRISIFLVVFGVTFFLLDMQACASGVIFPKFICTLVNGILPVYPYLVVGLFVLSCIFALIDYGTEKSSEG